MTTMSRLNTEKGMEILQELTQEQKVSMLMKAQSFQTLLMQYFVPGFRLCNGE